MSNTNKARRTKINVTFAGADITSSMESYLLELSYTDNQEDETDDLQIKLQDRDGIWREGWLGDMVDAAAEYVDTGTTVSTDDDGNVNTYASGLLIGAAIIRENWTGDGGDEVLDCGTFELDSVQLSGPPAVVTIKATSLCYQQPIRQTLKYKAWESYSLQSIASEIAGNAGYSLMYESSSNPYYERVEQYNQSDIDFLSELCHAQGISLKCFSQMIVLFDQPTYESKSAVRTITYADGTYSSFKCDTGTADASYQYCRVYYVDNSGEKYEGTAYADDYSDDEDATNQGLEIYAQCASDSEAEALALKYLRLHNKYECTVSVTMPGDPEMCAGANVELAGFGMFDGKYSIETAKHTVSSSGYKTVIDARKVLEGY